MGILTARSSRPTRDDNPASEATGNNGPHNIIWTLTNALVASRSLHVVAELGIADHLGDRPASAADLASHTGADADALDRVLRLLAAHGVFEHGDGGFVHTPASALLRSDHPMSMRAFARMMGLPLFSETFARLEHSVTTGSPAVETVEPHGLWAYFQDRSDEALIFGEAMTARAAADIGAILEVYDFTRFGTIVDVGGGRGQLLRAVLDAAPAAQGTLFDLPAVIDALGVEHERMTPQAGDFFADPPPAADAYVLMEIMHDWGDAECATILSAIRRAAAPGATLLVIENVLPDDKLDPAAQTLDVLMLAVTGGRERTLGQLSKLLIHAGFTAGTVIETVGRLRIVEARAV